MLLTDKHVHVNYSPVLDTYTVGLKVTFPRKVSINCRFSHRSLSKTISILNPNGWLHNLKAAWFV